MWRRRLPDAGDCDFLVDPRLRADEANVFWHAEAYSSVVLLRQAPDDFQAMRFIPEDWRDAFIRRDEHDGAHLVVGPAGNRHQLWLPEPPPSGTPLAAVITLDGAACHRAEAALRFWQHVANERLPPAAAPGQRLARLTPALRALDGQLDGASYRTIATCLFDARRVDTEPWKTSSLRDSVIRLVRTGAAMVKGQYRGLLKPRQRE